MLKLSPAVSLKTTLRERSAAQDVRLTHPRLRRCCRKNKRDIRNQQSRPRTLHGLFVAPVMLEQLHQVIISDSNRTPIIQIVVWFCLATAFLALVTHAGIKLFVFRAVKAESVLLLVSLVSSKTHSARCNTVDCPPRCFASHSQRLC